MTTMNKTIMMIMTTMMVVYSCFEIYEDIFTFLTKYDRAKPSLRTEGRVAIKCRLTVCAQSCHSAREIK